MDFTYNWNVYGKRKVGDLNSYMPEYKQQNIARPISTYTPTQYSDSRGTYAKDISSALAELNKVKASKPGAYTSQYNERINSLIDQIAGRKFSYDVNRDAAYQAMRDNYINLGQQAAADTAGQNAALTGGYGNSYGTVAANQAYQSYLAELSNRIPELQQMALQRYNAEGDEMNNMYNILNNQENTEYSKYRDALSDWRDERAFADTSLNNLRSMNQNLWGQDESNRYNANAQAWNNYWQGENYDQNAYMQALEMARNRRNDDVSYNQWADQMTENAKQNSWQRAFSEAQAQDSNRQFSDEMAYKYAALNASNSSSSSSSSSNSNATAYADGSKELGYAGNSNTTAFLKKYGKAKRYMDGTTVVDVKQKILDKSNGLTLAERAWLLDQYGF